MRGLGARRAWGGRGNGIKEKPMQVAHWRGADQRACLICEKLPTADKRVKVSNLGLMLVVVFALLCRLTSRTHVAVLRPRSWLCTIPASLFSYRGRKRRGGHGLDRQGKKGRKKNQKRNLQCSSLPLASSPKIHLPTTSHGLSSQLGTRLSMAGGRGALACFKKLYFKIGGDHAQHVCWLN